jgi:ketosteroid isomerase-like protein
VETIRAVYEGFARRDVDAVVRHLHPDCEFRPFGTNQLSGRELPYRGAEGIRQYFADVDATWELLEIQARDFRAAGSSVIVFGQVRGRSLAGEPMESGATWVWKLREGLAVDGRVFPTGEAAREWAAGD